MDAAKGAKSSDTNPLIPPKLHSLFKKKKVVEVTSRPQVAPSLGECFFLPFEIFFRFLVVDSFNHGAPLLFQVWRPRRMRPHPKVFLFLCLQ